ncbi:hypothetical protein AJ79_06147 [Helicocarpus griseus UAMH5409]|uniref:F-box domain-containing protein n=1 Tax=Helicocarpus griseus UAMH5409 TaxID=1447875 RepID=A0A2B7XGA9_9EURO|nr:hypothetical protein AJ79_06147 [Helicocarpus griseus UAMH5409]
MSVSLTSLPPELIGQITCQLNLRDLISFSQTARLFYNISIPRIYRAAVKYVISHEREYYVVWATNGCPYFYAPQSVLEWAANKGYAKLAEGILKIAPKGRFGYLKYKRTLELAALRGLASTVELLFENCGCHLLPARDGYIALDNAASAGHISVVNRLLKLGVNPAAAQKCGLNALDVLAARGDLKMVRLLVNAGADVSLEDSMGRTAVHYAAAGGHKEMVKFLLAAGADISSVDRYRRSALFNAALGDIDGSHGGKRIAIPRRDGGNAEVVKLLASFVTELSLLDIRGVSVLHALCEKGYIVELQALLDTGLIPIDIKDIAGFTALHHAVYAGHREVVDMLLDAGADINATDFNGRSLVHIAVIGGQHRLLEHLLSKGLDFTLCDNDGWMALHHAAYEANQEIFDVLLQANTGQFSLPPNEKRPLTLHKAAEKNNARMIQLLIDSGADLSSDKSGWYPLDAAITPGHTDIVQLLLKHGANPNELGGEYPPLNRACELGHEAIVQVLLDHGADPLLRDHAGETPIYIASCGGHIGILNRLINAGADIKDPDSGSQGALIEAVENDQTEIATLLINNGADVSFVDEMGKTALYEALEKHDRELVDLLVQAGANPRIVNEWLDMHEEAFENVVCSIPRIPIYMEGDSDEEEHYSDAS